MARILKKEVVPEVNVYDAAIERFNYLFDNFDKVVVSFSGGKDSTVCLNLALEVARAKNKLPLDVYFWDEEAIHPETIDYVERVRNHPDIRFKWLCVPVKHRNACSRSEPYWYCWDETKKDKWVRPMPDNANVIKTVAHFKHGDSVPDIAHHVYGPEHGSVADVRGIRADESLRRYRSVAMKSKNNWIGAPRDNYSYPVSPIYDWTTFDVWTAPRLFGWDYNRSYDLMAMVGQLPNDQRVCPPYGEEPLAGFWIYKQCWPEMWHKMINRVHGAATAGRYANTELYGFGKLTLPEGKTWRQWTYDLLELYPKALRKQVAANIAALIAVHQSKTNRPIHETDVDMMTGLSWKFLAMIANRGDLKLRRSNQVTANANLARDKAGVTIESLVEEEYATRY
jgi:predicted phosphoadenosine phosphosulfate sulfurtransferase